MPIPLIYADSTAKQVNSDANRTSENISINTRENTLENTLNWLKQAWCGFTQELEVANFQDANFQDANFNEANINDTNFNDTNSKNAKLEEANLKYTKLKHAIKDTESRPNKDKTSQDTNLELQFIKTTNKLTQKERKRISATYVEPVLILDETLKLSLLINGISVSPDWKSLQRRVVSAGRKSELLLQACKINEASQVLDATAGFGHDSLILASTGAQVTMLERHPIMALLLKYEKHQMSQQQNWQKLMSRLHIRCDDAYRYLMSEKQLSVVEGSSNTDTFDVIYLDPMFPESSYEHSNNKGAKVGKHMQALHHIAQPPNFDEEQQLLNLALSGLNSGGKVMVKRPVMAPVFANKEPDVSWQNDVVRFDAYFNC